MIEIEKKLSISLKDFEKVFLYFKSKEKISRVREKFMPRDYYDTDDLDLFNSHVSLRVQKKNGVFEQTVKFDIPQSKNSKNKLFRKEIKNDLSSSAPDLCLVNEKQISCLQSKIQGKPLRHIFTAAAHRRFFTCKVGRGQRKDKVEIAFDLGHYIFPVDGSRMPLVEIEIESKAGDPKAIDRVCKKILKIAPSAKVIDRSKSQIGTSIYIEKTKP